MAKRPIAFISFQFEPVSMARLFDDPRGDVQTAALNLLIWRRGKGGKAEVDEVHEIGRAQSIAEFERLTAKVGADLRGVERDAKEWFPARRSFWR